MARECRGDSANLDIILFTSGALGSLGLSWRPGSSYEARKLRLMCDFYVVRNRLVLTLLTLLY